MHSGNPLGEGPDSRGGGHTCGGSDSWEASVRRGRMARRTEPSASSSPSYTSGLSCPAGRAQLTFMAALWVV
jgi:hypothetical protein